MTFPQYPTHESQRSHGRADQQNAHDAPPRTVPPRKVEDAGNSWGWHVVDALITLCGGSTNGLVKTARERVTTALWLLGATLVVLVVLGIFIAIA